MFCARSRKKPKGGAEASLDDPAVREVEADDVVDDVVGDKPFSQFGQQVDRSFLSLFLCHRLCFSRVWIINTRYMQIGLTRWVFYYNILLGSLVRFYRISLFRRRLFCVFRTMDNVMDANFWQQV